MIPSPLGMQTEKSKKPAEDELETLWQVHESFKGGKASGKTVLHSNNTLVSYLERETCQGYAV